jgi:hypothetical protein
MFLFVTFRIFSNGRVGGKNRSETQPTGVRFSTSTAEVDLDVIEAKQDSASLGGFQPHEYTVSSARRRPLGYCAQNGRFPNKQLIARYLDFGEDSDIGRVRVLGLPPMADEPLVAGFDASGSGAAGT